MRPVLRLLGRLAWLAPAALLLAGCARPAERAAIEPAAPGPEVYGRLADVFDAHLRDVLARWYPACVDPGGGFHQRLSREWQRLPEEDRFLVYQARQTWVAAAAALYDPALKDEFSRYALHGLDYLDKTMSDRQCGGLYFRLGPDGRVSEKFGPGKHAYGLSFAIYAAAAVYEATGDERALALALATFRWLDEHAHDGASGGYFEALSREGTPILAPPRPGATDGIGTPYGYKSMNTHIHLLEAVTALYRATPDPAVRVRLEELLEIVRDRIAVEPGALNYYFTPAWRAVPMHDSFGHDIETAYLLVEAAEALGCPDDERTWRVARSLVDHALDWGWDGVHGGFFYGGQAFAAAHDRVKSWWTQAEGLNALLLMHERYGRRTPRYWQAFLKQWQFIRDYQVDPTYGGWYGDVTEGGARKGSLDKATPWKAAYHNGRALMNVVRRLRAMAAEPGGGWQALFNGKDLAGWTVKCKPADKDRAFWKVDGGTILADSLGATGHDYVWLVSDADVADFALRLKFQAYRGTPGNSGVQVRSRYDDEAGWLDGPQVDIHPPGPWRTGMIWDETRGSGRWLWPEVPRGQWVDPSMARPGLTFRYADDDPAWNDLEITCAGTKMKAVLNGVTVMEYDGAGVLDDEVHRQRRVGMSGRVALQIHKGDQVKIRFKDIFLKDLSQ